MPVVLHPRGRDFLLRCQVFWFVCTVLTGQWPMRNVLAYVRLACTLLAELRIVGIVLLYLWFAYVVLTDLSAVLISSFRNCDAAAGIPVVVFIVVVVVSVHVVVVVGVLGVVVVVVVIIRSQNLPSYASGHSHVTLSLRVATHVPPFRHGVVTSHGSLSQWAPLYGEAHAQR